MFFKFLHDNQYFSEKVRRVGVTAIEDDARGFDELPSNTLDRSDRKFLAVAVADHARVVNALDGDWQEQSTLLDDLGVAVRQLCPDMVNQN